MVILCSWGHNFSYFPVRFKCFIVVASTQHLANDISGDWVLKLLKDTGGFIGESGDRQDYGLQKVHQWSDLVRALTFIITM